MRIAVLGGGNGAFAAAADLTEKGHEVRWWRRDASGLRPRLTLKDADGERAVAIATCPDIGEAVRGAELVFMPDPAFTQEDNAARLAPHLADDQLVFLAPGNIRVLSHGLRDSKGHIRGNRHAAVAHAQARSRGRRDHHARDAAAHRGLPCREVEGSAGADRKGVPGRACGGCAFCGAHERRADHPPAAHFHERGPLEHFERWDIHKEGTQPAIRRVTDALDAERIAAREALGYRAPHFPLADHYRADGDEWMYGRRVHKKLTDSGDWRERIVLAEHRYMREDVALGLAFLVSVCEYAGVACPVARGLLALGSAVLGRDLRATGRTLEKLGLAGLTRDELRRVLT